MSLNTEITTAYRILIMSIILKKRMEENLVISLDPSHIHYFHMGRLVAKVNRL